MGNCVLKLGFGETEIEREKNVVKVVSSDGGIMELLTPITVESITNEFPGHSIFKNPTIFSQPLLHRDELQPGQIYYLLPLNMKLHAAAAATGVLSTPYRMSTCNHENQNGSTKKRGDPEVFPKYSKTGVWKVKLVISQEQLSEILSEENRTEELIENVRTVAKCGNGVVSAANSDHSSIASSSWKGSAMDKA